MLLYLCSEFSSVWISPITHWGRVTHICVSNLTIIGSDNGLSPGRHQAIIRTNAGILLIGPLGTNFSEILIKILTFSFKKMRLKVSSGKWRPFCLGLNVLSEGSHPSYGHNIKSFDKMHFLQCRCQNAMYSKCQFVKSVTFARANLQVWACQIFF